MAGAPQSIAPSKSGRPPTGAATGRAPPKKPSAAPFAPPPSLNDLKKARDAGALQRQLISSEADFGKFEVHAATLVDGQILPYLSGLLAERGAAQPAAGEAAPAAGEAARWRRLLAVAERAAGRLPDVARVAEPLRSLVNSVGGA